MLRTALRPRFLGLLGLVVLVGIAFGFLGRWQLGVAESSAHREAVEQARSRAPVALTTVLEPQAPFRGDLSSRPVTVTGRYAAEGQLLVPDRRLRGEPGMWVITPFVVEGSGATLAVLRGFVTEPADAGPPPTGTLTLSGGLAPGESPVADPVAAGQIGSVDLSLLVNAWPGAIYNAFLFLESEDPASGPQLTKVPTPLADTGIQWRNAAYAVQWWIFALFALWVWFRMVREETRRDAESAGAARDQGEGAGVLPGPDAGRPGAAQPVPAGENGARDDA